MASGAVALYRRGPRWRPNPAFGEQEASSDHIAFPTPLARREDVEAAGPFSDLPERAAGDVIGMVVFVDAHAEPPRRESKIAASAVLAEVMTVEVLRWHR